MYISATVCFIIRKQIKHVFKFRAIDLFAGIGGIRLGIEWAFGNKIEFIWANEIDKYACQTYEQNFGEFPMGDITKTDIAKIPDFDLLFAGFPCQAFSIAGHKKGFHDTRGTLFFYIEKILEYHQPEAFLLENVAHLEHHDRGNTFKTIKYILEKKLGYTVYHKVLESCDFGVPQRRPRIFIVGFKNNYRFEFPKPINRKTKLIHILESEVDEKYYLSQQYLDTLKKHKERHRNKGNGFGYEILQYDGIANTLVVGGMGHERNLIVDLPMPYEPWQEGLDKRIYRNNEGVRKLTEREWARLQGFPDDFEFPVSRTQTYKQIANSVTVPVIEAIGMQMLKSLTEQEVISIRQSSLEPYLLT